MSDSQEGGRGRSAASACDDFLFLVFLVEVKEGPSLDCGGNKFQAGFKNHLPPFLSWIPFKEIL